MDVSKKMQGLAISRIVFSSTGFICCITALGFGIQYLTNPGALASLGYLNTKNITLIISALLLTLAITILIDRLLLMIQSKIQFGESYKKNSILGDFVAFSSLSIGTLYILSKLHELQKSSNAGFALLIDRLNTIKTGLPSELAANFGDLSNMVNALTEQQIHDEVIRLQQFLTKTSIYLDGFSSLEKAEKIAQTQSLLRDMQAAIGGVERDNAGIKLIVQFMVIIAAVALVYLIGRAWKNISDSRYKMDNSLIENNTVKNDARSLKRLILSGMPITLEPKYGKETLIRGGDN